MPEVSGGMHKFLSPEAKARRKIKNARNLSRKQGISASNGTTHHMPCSSYAECKHAKHRVPAKK